MRKYEEDIEIVYDSVITRSKTEGHKEAKSAGIAPKAEEVEAIEFIDLPDEVYPEWMR